jgi:hypothetical protein
MWLASSKILTPLTARRVCPPPAFGEGGGGHTRWLEGGGWGVNILEDVRRQLCTLRIVLCR